MVRYLCLQRVAPEFDGQVELVEIRLSIPAIDHLHITTLGTIQEHRVADAWYVRVTWPQENMPWAEWPTLLLNSEPHTNFPLELEVPGPPEFHDGDWLDSLWRWFQFQFAAQKQHFDELVAESAARKGHQQDNGSVTRAGGSSDTSGSMSPGTQSAPEMDQQNPAALYDQMQTLLQEMQEMSYADLHPMEAAVQAFINDANKAKEQRHAVQRQIVALHAVAVPAFGAAMQDVVTSDDEQWEKTRHWILDMGGVPLALANGEVTPVMQGACATALRSFRDDLPAAEVGERYAQMHAHKLCAMTPRGHVFLAKDPIPRLCTRCGLPWQEGQPLLSEHPRVYSAPIISAPSESPAADSPGGVQPRKPSASAFLT